jgi:hypothetical protein
MIVGVKLTAALMGAKRLRGSTLLGGRETIFRRRLENVKVFAHRWGAGRGGAALG